MSEVHNIKALTEKYWAGETTLEEERILNAHYGEQTEQGPEQALFSFLHEERSVQYTKEVTMPVVRRSKWTTRLLSIAATLLILMGSWWGINQATAPSNKVTIDDPQLALQITREAFALINGKVDKGEQAIMDNILHLDKTLIFKNL